MFFKIDFLKNSAIFTGNHLCWSLFFNKASGLRQVEGLRPKAISNNCTAPENIFLFFMLKMILLNLELIHITESSRQALMESCDGMSRPYLDKVFWVTPFEYRSMDLMT